jgi:hypothetical protein
MKLCFSGIKTTFEQEKNKAEFSLASAKYLGFLTVSTLAILLSEMKVETKR